MQDVRLPGMVHARVVRPPSYGAKLDSVDTAEVEKMPGVVKIVRDGNFLAVVAQREFQAVKAMRKLSAAARWQEQPRLPNQGDLAQAILALPARDYAILDRRRPDVAALLMYVNAKMWIGHFDMYSDDGTILFRHAMIFPEAQASASQCEALLNLAVEACEYYYPAFQFVLWGGKSAEEAVAAAILECAGQA